MKLELDERIRQELLELYAKLDGEGKLLVGAKLTNYYETFRRKFGPDELRKLDGQALLEAIHGPGKESLVYWLEFKNDAEFPASFGSISGGSAYKFGLFHKKDTSVWTTGTPQNPVELSLKQAIEIARRHRDQLLAGCDLLADMPANGDDEDYEALQQEMDRVAPDISNTGWGHKYFSLLYPDKLDDYHTIDYQRFHLIKLLQPYPQMEGRFVAGGRFLAIAKTLKLAVNTLTNLLNKRNGDPHPYWRIGTRGWSNKQDYWAEMRDGKYCSIGWAKIGDLSALTDDGGREKLRILLQKSYPDKSAAEIGKISRQLFDFRWSMAKGDLVLASNGATVLGVGKITGDYIYDAASDFPHCRPVEWLSFTVWQQPDQHPDIEGKLTTLHRMKRVLNLLEVERQILDARYGPTTSNGKDHPQDHTWLNSIKMVLARAQEPLSDAEIARRAIDLGMQTKGKTPANTVNRVLNQNPHLFERAERGLYRLLSPGEPNGTKPVEFSLNDMNGQSKTPPERVVETFKDEKLAPVPEPLLTKLIAELRCHLLVEETLVRRIYHALLNGHVILTGPPGTGKTELARLLPEILWQSEDHVAMNGDTGDLPDASAKLRTRTAYTTTLVTATSEWSTRTLISSITPIVDDSRIAYRTQYGHLTEAILRNWAITKHPSAHWEFHGRKRTVALSPLNQDVEREYQGHWLIIDEFNRAPIDAALGEALTALGNGEALQVPIGGTLVRVPLPKDFRIIGTLNSFDRNYLNQISEALKRRFAFIEVSPPTRMRQEAEQGIVLYKVLKSLEHLSKAITLEDSFVNWQDVVMIGANTEGTYESDWNDEHPLHDLFHKVAWPLLEVLRVYRQLGTAQAIMLVRQWLTPGILQQYTTTDQWMEALDIALCDTIADQLQILLPDELDVLIWRLKFDGDTFIDRYNRFLVSLAGKQRRLTSHLEALSSIVNREGKHLLSDEDVEDLLEQEAPYIAPEILSEIFHLDHSPYQLPQFVRRLRTYKAEHGL